MPFGTIEQALDDLKAGIKHVVEVMAAMAGDAA